MCLMTFIFKYVYSGFTLAPPLYLNNGLVPSFRLHATIVLHCEFPMLKIDRNDGLHTGLI